MVTLSQVLPPTRSGRTFFVASALLGLCALFQLGFLGWYFARGGAHAAAVAQAPAAPNVPHFAETMQPTVAAVDEPSAPASSQPNPAGDAADSSNGYAVLPQPTPAPGQRLPGGSSGDALEQARALRQRGDMRAALSRLREALVAEPDNAQAIAELALTYEAMPDLGDKATEQWQRIYNLGESVGAPYYLADVKLHGGGNPTAATGDATTRRTGSSTSVDNTVLKITDLSAEDIPDPSMEKKVALKIVVKSRPGIVIDATKVRIDAYFYDLLDGKDIVQTDAQTDYAWLTPPPINWANDKSEVLEALYVRPKGVALIPGAPALGSTHTGSRRSGSRGGKGKTPAAPDPAEAQPSPGDSAAAPVRAYLGYSVRLYYGGQLQEVQAEPVRLLQQFQAPLTLPAEGNQPSDNSSAPH